MIIRMKKTAAIFFSFFIFAFSYAEKYRISQVEYNIEGITRQYVLENEVKIDKDKIFDTYEDFKDYIDNIYQEMINLRFAKTLDFTLTYQSGDEESELAGPVETTESEEIVEIKLKVHSVDSKHLIILPYYKYDDNKGHQVKFTITDENFCGTLSKLDTEFFMDSKRKDEGRSEELLKPRTGLDLKYNYPFMMGSIYTKWNNIASFTYNFDDYEPNAIEYKIKSGLSFTVPTKTKRVNVDFDVNFMNEQNNLYWRYGDDNYCKFDAKVGFPVLIKETEKHGDLKYTPFVSFDYAFDWNGINKDNEDLISPKPVIGQTISFGQVNWIGNFRNGFKVSGTQSIGYNFGKREGENLVPRFDVKFEGFKNFKYVGLACNVNYFFMCNQREEVGKTLRGIMDKQYYKGLADYALKTEHALTINLDLPIKIFSTDWKKIFKNWNWTDYLNFELQISPFLDIGLTKNKQTGRSFDLRDGFYGAGIEVLVYPLHWRSLVVRLSVGIDIGRKLFPELIDTSWRSEVSTTEINFGMGWHY